MASNRGDLKNKLKSLKYSLPTIPEDEPTDTGFKPKQSSPLHNGFLPQQAACKNNNRADQSSVSGILRKSPIRESLN